MESKQKWRNTEKGKVAKKKAAALYYSSKKGKETIRNNRYKRTYGITLDDFNSMFVNQNGCCKICGTHQSELKQALCIDHCHNTQKVRGLLCHECNHGLGKFKDNIEYLQKAIDYLKI